MSENQSSTGSKKSPFKSFATLLLIAFVVALVLSPKLRYRIWGQFRYEERRLHELRELLDAELATNDMPGVPRLADPEIIHTGLMNFALRQAWHRTPEGSDVFPVALFRAMTDPKTGKPFIESFPNFGFVPAPTDDTGLPVGFSRVRSPDHDFVLTGINCATCHSTQIHFNNRILHVDGAPNMLDVEAFFRGTVSSLENVLNETGADHLKFIVRFIKYNWMENLRLDEAQNVTGRKSALQNITFKNIEETVGFLRYRLASAKTIIASFEKQTAAGPGRADSFGIIRNLLMTKDVVGADNFQPMTAPVAMPHLFGFASFTNLHWDGNTTTGTDRNYAQAIALGASFDPATLKSSVRPYDLLKMEETARLLVPPKWPEELLGKLDAAKISRGAEIFRTEGCAECHAREHWVQLEKIGTDPARLVNYAVPLDVGGGRTESYATNLFKSAVAIKKRAFADNSVPPADQEKIEAWHYGVAPAWIETRDKGYLSRPLRGLWATAPYLHNNSVPTLWDLFQPPAQRPKKFFVGHRDFDPQKVGFTQPAQGIWEFDTSIPGNLNTGHNYGTALTDDQKRDLIEFLKTL